MVTFQGDTMSLVTRAIDAVSASASWALTKVHSIPGVDSHAIPTVQKTWTRAQPYIVQYGQPVFSAATRNYGKVAGGIGVVIALLCYKSHRKD